jgi:hypothetical protein
MAFEITRHTIYQLIAKMGCGCKKIQEFEDTTYAKAVGEGLYSGCAKHAETEGGEIISTILGEYLETEAKRESTARQVQPGVVVDGEGNEIGHTVPSSRPKPPHRRATLSSAAMPPTGPKTAATATDSDIDLGNAGDGIDALLAADDPTEHPVTIVPTKTSKS